MHFVHAFFSPTCKCGATALDVSCCFLFTSALLLVWVRKRVAVSAGRTIHCRRFSSHVYKRSATTATPPPPPTNQASPQTAAVEANKLNLWGSDASPRLPVWISLSLMRSGSRPCPAVSHVDVEEVGTVCGLANSTNLTASLAANGR